MESRGAEVLAPRLFFARKRKIATEDARRQRGGSAGYIFKYTYISVYGSV
jgi:hypothetical protein